ncbi:unnamed protein product [Oikopleura dioica]|uniref:Uncharacterized protein n=1 Tax=Oikopleura dioica TaxID=34765 RepID=E4Y2G9_OIKDI|nr:unnamed protein product [Oikopleura dioica]
MLKLQEYYPSLQFRLVSFDLEPCLP